VKTSGHTILKKVTLLHKIFSFSCVEKIKTQTSGGGGGALRAGGRLSEAPAPPSPLFQFMLFFS